MKGPSLGQSRLACGVPPYACPGLRGGRPMTRSIHRNRFAQGVFSGVCGAVGRRAAVGRALSADRGGHRRRLTTRCTATSAVAVEASTPTWHFADASWDAVGELRIVDPWKTHAEGGLCGEDGPPRCAAAGGCAPARQRGRHLLPARWRFANCASCVGDRHAIVQVPHRG